MDVLKTLIEEGSIFLGFVLAGFVGTFAVGLVLFTAQSIMDAFRRDRWDAYSIEDERVRAYGQQKLLGLIADGTLTIERVQSDEDEKPKRQFDTTYLIGEHDEPLEIVHSFEPTYIIGDDGELLEVIDDKPKRGISHDG